MEIEARLIDESGTDNGQEEEECEINLFHWQDTIVKEVGKIHSKF